MSETESGTAAEGTRTPAETTSDATTSIEWIRGFHAAVAGRVELP